MADIEEVLAPLETLAADRLQHVDAPYTRPAEGDSVGELRQWAMEQSYHDRVAAGVAIGCAYARRLQAANDNQNGQASTAGVIVTVARVSEWGAVLRLLEHGAAVEVGRLEEVFPDTLRGLEMRPGRRKGAFSPLKQWIYDYLTRNPNATNKEITKRLRYDEPRAKSYKTSDRDQTGLTFEGEPIPKKKLRERAHECRKLLGIK